MFVGGVELEERLDRLPVFLINRLAGVLSIQSRDSPFVSSRQEAPFAWVKSRGQLVGDLVPACARSAE